MTAARRIVTLSLLSLLGSLCASVQSCGGGGGGPDTPFPDDLPSRDEVLARAYSDDPFVEGFDPEPYPGPMEQYGGLDYGQTLTVARIAGDSGGERLASAADVDTARGMSGIDSADMPDGYVEEESRVDETSAFWDFVSRGTVTAGDDAVRSVRRFRVLKRAFLDTRTSDYSSSLGRSYRNAALSLAVAGTDAMRRGEAGADPFGLADVEAIAHLDWWLEFQGVPGASIVDHESAETEGEHLVRLRYTNVDFGESGATDQVYLCEVVYGVPVATPVVTAEFRLLGQYAGAAG